MPRAFIGDDVVDSPFTSSSAGLRTGEGGFYGLVCITSSSLNVAVYDATSATGNPLWSGPLTAGQIVSFDGKCLRFQTGLYLNIVSGTGSVRALVK
ncbi:MAG: hypothetical protein KBG29_18415 [Pseudomonadales bacterium]|nr:hypothetical protein [Pseudomonadales bacterium]